MIMRLVNNCDEEDISVGFDCGFVLCMFTEEEIGRLFLANARFRSSCGVVLDIGTDLSVWACFPLSTFCRGVHLTDYGSIAEVSRYFDNEFGRLYNTGAMDQCITCKYRKRKQCTGGCASHVYRRLNA